MVIPFQDEPEPEHPALPGEVHVGQTREDLLDLLAADVHIHAKLCTRKCGDFHLLMTAGPGPEALCVKLMTDPAYRELPWRKTHLWLAAEALVDPNDESSTYARLAELLLGHAGIPRSNIHRVPHTAGDPARRYGRAMLDALSRRDRGHDRPDCAVVSIDPDEPALGAPAWSPGPGTAAAFDTVAGDPPGIAATPLLLSATRVVALIGTGATCRGAVAGAVQGAPGAEVWARAQPAAGIMRWYLDHDACPAAPATRDEPGDANGDANTQDGHNT